MDPSAPRATLFRPTVAILVQLTPSYSYLKSGTVRKQGKGAEKKREEREREERRERRERKERKERRERREK